MLDHVKKSLVGTRTGQALADVSDYAALRLVPLRNPELASACANHVISRRLIRELCPRGGCFLDVGAHIGSVFSAVHRADPDLRIIAVEADPGKAAFLRRKYPFARVLECAAGDKTGTAEFFTHSTGSGYNSLLEEQRPEGARRIRVAIERLDDLLSGEAVDLVKIDVEGAELGVLRGAEELFARGRPVVMFESVGRQVNSLGYSPQMIWDWFAARDYAVLTPDRVAHDVSPLGRDTFLDAHDYPFRTHDYFAVPAEKAQTVRARAREILGVIAG